MNAHRLLRLLLAVALVLVLGGCAPSTHARNTTDLAGTLASGGRQRTYLLHLPGGAPPARPVPLLIALHGYGDTGADMAKLTGFDALADAQGFLVLYPDGVVNAWADRNNTYADRAGVDDVAFIAALIDQIAARYAVDPARIYATGLSNGGFMADLLACALPDRIAAVAPVAATMPVSLAQQCPAGRRPVSYLLIHGQDDPSVPPGGGMVQGLDGKLGPVLSDADAATFWATRDGCGAAPTVTDLPMVANDGTRVQQTTYTNCQVNAAVVYDAVAGAGHIWPVGKNLDSSAAIWAFFAAHPRRDAPAA